MGIAERVCYGLVAVYYATFLQSTFGLSLSEVALPLAVFALGNILGTLLGGQLADRMTNRLGIFAAAMLASGVAALALFGWQADLTTAVALGFGYVFCNAIARPSLMASLGDVPGTCARHGDGTECYLFQHWLAGCCGAGRLDDRCLRLRRLRPARGVRGGDRRRACAGATLTK